MIATLLWAVLAIAIFWVVGLFNRLVRMRGHAVQALRLVELQLRQYVCVLDVHLGAQVLHTTANMTVQEQRIAGDWIELIATLKVLDAALIDTQRTPFTASVATRLSEAVELVQKAWMRRCELPVDLAGPVVPEAMRQQWDTVTAAVHHVRTGCNQTLTVYNEAITQFPARMIVGVMRFEAAGLL